MDLKSDKSSEPLPVPRSNTDDRNSGLVGNNRDFSGGSVDYCNSVFRSHPANFTRGESYPGLEMNAAVQMVQGKFYREAHKR